MPLKHPSLNPSSKEEVERFLGADEGMPQVQAQTRSRDIFAGIPSLDKSKMWDFSLTEDGSGNRILSFLVDNKTFNFKLGPQKDGAKPIGALRLPDSESADFGVGGNATKGKVQIHKANPSKLTGTFQTGKTNMSFEMEKTPDTEHDWSIVSRKDPSANVATFVRSILEKKSPPKTAGFLSDLKNKFLDTKVPMIPEGALSYPLTGPLLGGLGVGAGIGAGAMALKNMYDRFNAESEEDYNPLWKDMLLGAGIGAAGVGGMRAMGKSNPPDPNAPINGKKPMGYFDVVYGNRMARVERLAKENLQKKSSEKVAFMTGNQTVDMIALQSILGADPTITQAERRALAGQARAAMSETGSTSIPVSKIQSSGFGMLAGYIISKMMGFGGLSSLAGAAIGGFIGNRMGSNSGAMWNSRGYYEY